MSLALGIHGHAVSCLCYRVTRHCVRMHIQAYCRYTPGNHSRGGYTQSKGHSLNSKRGGGGGLYVQRVNNILRE